MGGYTAERSATAAVLAATILLGTIGTAAELGPDEVRATTAAVWRTSIGAVVLVAWSVRSSGAPWSFPVAPQLLTLAGLGVAANQLAFFEAVDRTGVAVGTTVTLAAARNLQMLCGAANQAKSNHPDPPPPTPPARPTAPSPPGAETARPRHGTRGTEPADDAPQPGSRPGGPSPPHNP